VCYLLKLFAGDCGVSSDADVYYDDAANVTEYYVYDGEGKFCHTFFIGDVSSFS
jgi:hypothetical protein